MIIIDTNVYNALALETNASLATYDKDFEVFADMFGDKLAIISAID